MKTLLFLICTLMSIKHVDAQANVVEDFPVKSCNGTERNQNGSLNVERYLHLLGQNGQHPSEDELKRTISLESFFSLPRAGYASKRTYSLVEGLTNILAFHAAGAKLKIKGITPNIVTSNDSIDGFTYADIQRRITQAMSASITGLNNSSLTCSVIPGSLVEINDVGSTVTKRKYFQLTNGSIADPRGETTYNCKIEGDFKDLGIKLFTVLREVYTLQMNEKILEFNALSPYPPSSLERYEAYVKYLEESIPRLEENKSFFEYPTLNEWGLTPVNKIIINDDYSSRPKISLNNTPNSKAFQVIGSALCDVTLVCTKEMCKLVDSLEIKKMEDKLSTFEEL